MEHQSCIKQYFVIAPKAQFQLVAVCDVVDFGCPPGMCICPLEPDVGTRKKLLK